MNATMPDDTRDGRPAFPEVARSLRGLGAPRDDDSGVESVVFGPLLEARRAAERALTAGDAMRAFNAARISAELRDAVKAKAAARTTGRDDRRRALEAELEELVAPLIAALDGLAAMSDGAWDVWISQVQRVFTAADRVAAQLAARLAAP